MQWDKIILYSHNDNECQIANFWFSLQHMYYTKHLAVKKTELVIDHEWPTGPVRWSKENLAQCTTYIYIYTRTLFYTGLITYEKIHFTVT